MKKSIILVNTIVLISTLSVAQNSTYGSYKVQEIDYPTPIYFYPQTYETSQVHLLKQSFEIQYKDIEYIVKIVNDSFDDFELYIVTNYNGERKIRLDSPNTDGLFLDEKYAGIKLNSSILDLLFFTINYPLEVSISMSTFIQAMKNKKIMGMEFKTKSNLHNYTWEELLK